MSLWTQDNLRILQHHDPRVDISLRSVPAGLRLVGRDPHTGAPVVEPESYGDVLCYLLWRERKRTFPGWANCWPAAVDQPSTFPDLGFVVGDGGQSTTVGSAPTGQGPGLNELILPLQFQDYRRDERFNPRPTSRPTWAGRFPRGWPGLLVGGTDEHTQQEIWTPGGWGLVCSDDHPDYGTRLLRAIKDGEVDEDVWARLHQHVRVIWIGPTANGRVVGGMAGAPAWVLGPTPTGEWGYGTTIGPDGFRGSRTVVRGATASEVVCVQSHLGGGPLHAGDSRCLHGAPFPNISTTMDGQLMTRGHLWAGAAFMTGPNATEFRDAALALEAGDYPSGLSPVGGAVHKVRCQRGRAATPPFPIEPRSPDYWGWWVRILLEDEPPPPPWIPGDPLKPNTPSLAAAGPPSGPMKAWRRRRLLTTCGRELGVPAIVFAPQPIYAVDARGDRRSDQGIDQRKLDAMHSRPVVVGLHAVGLELGAGAWSGVVQTCPRHGQTRPAVAGWLVLLPGPVGPEHYDEPTPYSPADAVVPESGLLIPDISRLQIGGVADPRSGLQSGHQMQGAGGDLVVSAVDGAGAATETGRIASTHWRMVGVPLELPEIATPDTPAAGYGRVYLKPGGGLYWRDDGGTERAVAIVGGAPTAHAASHQDGGSDEIAMATTSNAGKVELATAAEVVTATDTARAVTPSALAGAYTRNEITAPGTPASGKVHEWIEADGIARQKDSAGLERRSGWAVGPWGSGADSDLTVDASGDPGSEVLPDTDRQWGSVTVPTGETWEPTATDYLREHSFHRLSVEGAISLSGAGRAGAGKGAGGGVETAGTAGTAATTLAAVMGSASGGGGSGGAGDTFSVGGAGGNGAGRTGPLLDGGGGGGGGDAPAAGDAGNAGNAATALASPYRILRQGREIAAVAFWGFGAGGAGGGGGGGSDDTSGADGGGGGAGAGGYTIRTPYLHLGPAAVIEADGRDGSAGSAPEGSTGGGGGGGGGGAGGRLRLVVGECNTTIASQSQHTITMANGAVIRARAGAGGAAGGGPSSYPGGAGGAGEEGYVSFELWGPGV